MQSHHHQTHHGKEKDILCFRHARSQFNEGEDSFYRQQSYLSYAQKAAKKDYRTDVLYNPKYIDAPLSAKGIEQCKRARQDPSLKTVDLILVSPLRRALQTASLVFGGLEVPIIACPQLTQSFRYSCDLSIPLDQKKNEFPNIDFSRIKSYSTHWEITEILGPKNLEVFHKFYEKNKEKSLHEQQKMICELVGNNILCESDQELHGRCRKIKDLLKHYKQNYNKIAIVSHWWTLTYLNDEGDFQNAKPFWTSLHRLLQVK